ncbi:MAG: hypothetical protein ABSB59_20680 [Streptosporangiaceae bacterium]
MMATAIGCPEVCAVTAQASRRFYVHVGSLGFLVAAQPSFFGEVAHALALSGASRALDQIAQDWAMFSSSEAEPALRKAADLVHDRAAEALRDAFQCIVQLIPSRFGETELLLGTTEEINAWCYEDGYLTYATDENAAAIMYAETGSLRRLRSQIRRSPDFDPSLQMISGHSLFLFDQKMETGRETAATYKKNSARLLRGYRRANLPAEPDESGLIEAIEAYVSTSEQTFEGDSVLKTCVSRGNLMVSTLLHSLPADRP